MSQAASPSQADKAASFRALHERPGAFVIPNPWDAGSARMLLELGYEALATSSGASAAVRGRKDGQLSRDEALAHAREIIAATDLPVAGDLENGFGESPTHVAETIRLAAAAGLVGGSIEDASGDPAKPIYDLEHAVERVAAAVAAARALPFPFTLVARSENFLHGRPDLDDTIRRLQAFEAAGADALFAPGLTTAEQIRTVCAAVTKPVNVVMGLRDSTLSVADLAALGVRRISLGSALSRAALGGLLRAAQEIRDHGTFTFAADAIPYAEVNRLMAR